MFGCPTAIYMLITEFNLFLIQRSPGVLESRNEVGS